MAIRTADGNVKDRQFGRSLSFVIKNAVQQYHDSIGVIDSSGYLKANESASGEKIVGFIRKVHAQDGSTNHLKGDTSATPPTEGAVDCSTKILPGVAVTGAASIADILKPVYLAYDDQTFTLTRPTLGAVVGVVTRWNTSTNCDILFLGLDARTAAAGVGQTDLLHVMGPFTTAQAATTITVLNGLVMPFRGRIVGSHAVITTAAAGASGTVTAAFTLGSTAISGGVITINTTGTSAIGSVLTGTAVTGLNSFIEGDTLSLHLQPGGVSMSLGAANFYIKTERLGV